MASGMDSYSAAKIEQLDRHATLRVYGRALDFDLGEAARRWRPIQPCLCVQDSPDNPCRCPRGHTWWLRSNMILAEGDSGRKDADGNELRYFDVPVESRILVESMRSVSAGAMKKRGGKIGPSGVGGITDPQGGRGGLGTSALMGWDDILAGIAISVVGGLLIEAGKALLSDDEDEDKELCYDLDSDSYEKC